MHTHIDNVLHSLENGFLCFCLVTAFKLGELESDGVGVGVGVGMISIQEMG